MRKCIVLVTLLAAVACGKDSSPTAPTNTATAVVTVTDLQVTAEIAGQAITYRGSHRINETGGRTAITVTAISYRAGDGQNTNPTLSSPVNIGAGSSANRSFTLTDDNGITTGATTLTATVSYTDDAGRANSASATADIVKPEPPPAVRFFTVFGVVSDLLTGRPVAGAAVAATDSANTRRTSTTDGNGYYSIAPVREGAVAVTVTVNGYQNATRTITLSGDTSLAIPLAATSSPPPPGLSCGAPSVVTCINGGHRGTPTALCRDGAWSCSTTPSGTCSSHGGVACRVCPGPLC